MADQASHDHEAMYCHACHHQWQRAGESIECPQCMSSSTEIITPENDPRHFHNRQQEGVASPDAAPRAPEPSAGQESPAAPHQPPAGEAGNSASEANGSGNNAPHTGGHLPRFTFRFTTTEAVPAVTFITFVTNNPPPQPATENPPPRAENVQPVTFWGMHFFPHVTVFPSAPPPTVNNSPPAEADPATQSSQPADAPQNDAQQQQPPQASQARPQPVMRTDMLGQLLASLFNPANAVFGDAVYTQEAFDRVLTQLRDQLQPGGAPPASADALARLQTRELDDAMLAGRGDDDGKAKCIVCVDDMVKGDKAAVLPCGHFFHGDCVMPWLKLHNTCPL
ncbi:990a8dda-53cb-44df-9637-c7399c2d416d [Thermothielavioides terrestris]|uniref:990a8dda-53cb-44df-9637-c7399c2d416d n=1 Tax=Thermothielavioides terrestris TaxID=2587410 RepID=A0A3S4D243_9PEZI|nr:990a8dda-53cb-44df-9637-c7399c2d416d [Thermothielavioides terrestris]